MSSTETGRPRASDTPVAEREGTRPRVLLIDDQPARLLTYESILEGVGVECVRALSGTEALAKLLKQEFAVILLDVSMPGMDGFETALAIREHPRFERTPIIFVTGVHVSELDVLKGYELGAIDYMPVPIVPEILRSKVALLVELYRRRTELQRLNTELVTAREQLEKAHAQAIADSQAQLEAQRLSQQDRAEKEWLAAVLNSMNEEVYFTDPQQRYTYANPAAIREFGHASLAGTELKSVLEKLEVLRPDGSMRPVSEAPPLRALTGELIRDEEQIVRIPRTGELRHRQVSSAPVRNASGEIIGSVSVARDVTERKRIENELRARDARLSALVRLGDEFRALTTPSDLAFAAARVLGETLSVSHCGYGNVDPVNETIVIERGWRQPGIGDLPVPLHFHAYGDYVEDLKRGEIARCVDAERDPRTRETAGALIAISARSFVNMPIVEGGRIVAMLYLSDRSAREWAADELAFMRDVAERTRVAVERRRSEQALANDLKDTRLLRDVAAHLVREDDASTLFNEILAAAMTITEADGGAIQLHERDRPELTPVATRGAQHGFHCAQSSPLISREGLPLGMLTTHWSRAHQPSERELRFLDLLARQAADLVERMQAREKLRASEHQLRDADRRKDEFLAVLAHELRNPLVPIRTGVEVLKSMQKNPAMLETLQPMMERQVGHMVRLIDDLLDVSRITSGKIELQRQPVTLASIVTSAVEANRSALASGNLDLSINLEDPSRVLNVDPTRFSQVISNLLQNATKFTGPGGKVAIRASIEGSDAERSLVIRVTDTGEGIPEALLPRVFDLFTQAQPGIGRHAGLGIGLALARRLVELHGGTIQARSDGVGKGSEFIVRIPAPLASGTEVLADHKGRGALEGLRVIVVDDNHDGADAMGLLLTGMGCDVRVVYDGPAALALLETFAADVVLLDIGMPGMDGYETCQRIRGSGAPIVVIAITGWGQEQDRRQAAQVGFDAHLTKPAGPAQLAELLARARR
jgi:PAS domain S-box-containing protein